MLDVVNILGNEGYFSGMVCGKLVWETSVIFITIKVCGKKQTANKRNLFSLFQQIRINAFFWTRPQTGRAWPALTPFHYLAIGRCKLHKFQSDWNILSCLATLGMLEQESRGSFNRRELISQQNNDRKFIFKRINRNISKTDRKSTGRMHFVRHTRMINHLRTCRNPS